MLQKKERVGVQKVISDPGSESLLMLLIILVGYSLHLFNFLYYMSLSICSFDFSGFNCLRPLMPEV